MSKGKDEILEWHVVHCHTRCEYKTAQMLQDKGEVQVYCPRIRFLQRTQKQVRWQTEALFPSYFFAKFNAENWFRFVNSAQGVIRILTTNGQPATLKDEWVEQLIEEMNGQEIFELKQSLKVGDEVELQHQSFRGLKGIVTSTLKSSERVTVLLEFLGAQQQVCTTVDQIISPKSNFYK
jgi:transcriptional antiterminator RfaH